MTDQTPTPGSAEAQAAGCKCPAESYLGTDVQRIIDEKIMRAVCPLHGKKREEEVKTND